MTLGKNVKDDPAFHSSIEISVALSFVRHHSDATDHDIHDMFLVVALSGVPMCLGVNYMEISRIFLSRFVFSGRFYLPLFASFACWCNNTCV